MEQQIKQIFKDHNIINLEFELFVIKSAYQDYATQIQVIDFYRTKLANCENFPLFLHILNRTINWMIISKAPLLFNR